MGLLWAARHASNLLRRPMSSARVLTTTLWVVPMVLQSAIAVAIAQRKLVKAFPVFLCYTVLVPSRDVALLFLRYPGNTYAYVYWWGDALAVALGLGVVFENLLYILPSHPRTAVVLKSVWMVGALPAATAILLWVSTPVGLADRGLDWVVLLERSARFLQACMLLVVMVF